MNPRDALDALLLALVDRDGVAATRELLERAAMHALRPPTTDPNPDAWHTADIALGFGAHLLAEELLGVIERRKTEARVAQALAKPKRTT